MAANDYVLLTMEPPRTQAIVERIRGLPSAIVREILGPYDVVIELEADTQEDLDTTVRMIRHINGVVTTVTCIWF